MNLSNPLFQCALAAVLYLVAVPTLALNIVLTNDDSWNTENIRELKRQLEDAGHQVLMSAPCIQQSGKGGAVTLFKHMPVDDSRAAQNEFCVGDSDLSKPYGEFVEGTPTVAALYGIDVLAPRYWQAPPDLLVSGPNEGNNLGIMNNNSGTLGAAMIAIGRGIPAIATSANQNSGLDPSQAPKIAKIIVDLIQQLEGSRAEGEPLMPHFSGLNVNFPEDLDASKGIKHTQVGWNASFEARYATNFAEEELFMGLVTERILASGATNDPERAKKIARHKYRQQSGVSVRFGNLGDDDPESEANAVAAGYIAVSTIDANVQASDAKAELMRARLAEGGSSSPSSN